MAGAVPRHPAGEFEAEATRPTGDEVGAVATETMARLGGLADRDLGKVEIEHVFPDVFPGSHEAEGFDHFGDGEDVIRQRHVAAVVELRLEIREHARDVGGLALEVLGEINDKEADVVSQRLEADLGIAVDVDLADLHVAAEGLEDGEVLRNEVTGEGVEDGIDPLPVRDLHDVVGELQGPRVEDVVHAHVLEELAFPGAAGGGENGESEMFRNLDRGLPHPAGAGVDEDALALLHPGEFIDGVMRGEEDRRQGRRLGEAHRRGFPEDHVPVHGDVAAETIGSHADNVVAGFEILHRRTDPEDRAGEVVAEPFQIDGLARVDPEGLHDVAEIDPARLHEDFDLIGARIAAARLIEGEICENAGLFDLETVGRDRSVLGDGVAFARRQLVGLDAVDAADVATIAPVGDFMFLSSEGDLGDEVFDFVRVVRGVEVDLGPDEIGLLVVRDAEETGERSRSQTRESLAAQDRHRASGEEKDAGTLRPIAAGDEGEELPGETHPGVLGLVQGREIDLVGAEVVEGERVDETTQDRAGGSELLESDLDRGDGAIDETNGERLARECLGEALGQSGAIAGDETGLGHGGFGRGLGARFVIRGRKSDRLGSTSDETGLLVFVRLRRTDETRHLPEVAAGEEFLPSGPSQERGALAEFLVGETPPTGEQTEDVVEGGTTPGHLEEHEDTVGREGFPQIAHRHREVGGGVDHVRSHDEVEMVRFEPLGDRILFAVEDLVFDEGEFLLEAILRRLEEGRTIVREEILGAIRREDRENLPSERSRAGPDFEDADGAALGEILHRGGEGKTDLLVDHGEVGALAVETLHHP